MSHEEPNSDAQNAASHNNNSPLVHSQFSDELAPDEMRIELAPLRDPSSDHNQNDNNADDDDDDELNPSPASPEEDPQSQSPTQKSKRKQRQQNRCPEEHANIISRATYLWMYPTLWTGWRRALESSDLPALHTRCRSESLHARYLASWDRECRRRGIQNNRIQPTTATSSKRKSTAAGLMLFLALMRTFWKEWVIDALDVLVVVVLQLISPFLLQRFLIHMNSAESPWWLGYCLALLMFVIVVTITLLMHFHWWMSFKYALQARATVLSHVMTKTLRLSSLSRRHHTSGEMINFLAIDGHRILIWFWDMTLLWSAPLQIVAVLSLLFYVIGISALVGFGAMVALLPLNYLIMHVVEKYQGLTMLASDERTAMWSEMLQGIRIVKLMSWEGFFLKKISNIRAREISKLKITTYFRAINSFMWSASPVFVSLITFTTYSLLGNKLDAPLVFTALALFNALKDPLTQLPETLSETVLAIVSLRRLETFFLAPETQGYVKHLNEPLLRDNDPNGTTPHIPVVVSISGDAQFCWNHTVEEFNTTRSSEEHDSQELKPMGTESPSPAESSDLSLTLSDINLDVRQGDLVAIVGRVGCGKSSLLSALLGEINCIRGEVSVCGNIAYTSQQPWIMNDTLQNNILFGESFDKERYQRVIHECALEKDLAMLPAGDQTEIGEKGLNLSGGQKQRVNIARAVYRRDVDTYLFDEPLSAVDAHVGKWIFEHCMLGESLSGKTRILVTHQLQFLPFVDKIVVIDNGVITHQGTFEELQSRGIDLSSIVKKLIPEESSNEVAPEIDSKVAEQGDISIHPSHDSPQVEGEEGSTRSPELHEIEIELVEQKPLQQQQQSPPPAEQSKQPLIESSEKKRDGKLTSTEERQFGSVSISVYWSYVRNFGGSSSVLGVVVFLVVLFLFISSQLCRSISDWWMASWSNFDNSTIDGVSLTVVEWFHQVWNMLITSQDMAAFFLSIYGLWAISYVVIVFGRQLVLAKACLTAARTFHNRLLASIVRAPLSFFDVTPLGRILNRASKDLNCVDVNLFRIVLDMLSCGIIVVSSIITVSIVTPAFLIPLVPILLFYFFVQKFYQSSSREIKRLDSISRSPLFAYFQQTVNGLPTIRAFSMQPQVTREHFSRVDESSRMFFYSTGANRWLGYHLEITSCLVLLFASFFSVISRGYLSPGLAGLSIIQALSISGSLNWTVRMATEMEMQMNSVERINHYTFNIPSEAPYVLKGDSELHKKGQESSLISKQVRKSVDSSNSSSTNSANNPAEEAPGWPWRGEIVFENLKLRYQPHLPLVLHGLSCTIHEREKVGIVGRTGAGKSSLTQALFRLVEPCEGTIFVDGIDIRKIGLRTLRGGISMIPQDCILFSGTIRSNLDPAGEHSDSELWDSLNRAHLKDFIANLPKKLESTIDENGENFSVGQRQLIALARALLRRNRILVLDEATASLDFETDRLVQQTIRKEFSECTIVTIAHRISTIMDYDRVMVLSDGKIVEFDRPSRLLRKENGLFRSLVNDVEAVTGLQIARLAKHSNSISNSSSLSDLQHLEKNE